MPTGEALRIARKIDTFMEEAERTRKRDYRNATTYFGKKWDELRSKSEKEDFCDALVATLRAGRLASISNEIKPTSASQSIFRGLAGCRDPLSAAAVGRTLDSEGFIEMARHLEYANSARVPTNNAYFEAFVSNRRNTASHLAGVSQALGHDSHATTILEFYTGRDRSPGTRQEWSHEVPSPANLQGVKETYAYVPWPREATDTRYLENPATADPSNPGPLNPDYIEHDPNDPHLTADQYVASRNAYQAGLPAGSQTKTYTKLDPEEFERTNFRQGGQTFNGAIPDASVAPTIVVFGHGNDVTGTPEVTGSLYARGGSLASEGYDPQSMYSHLMTNPTLAIQGQSEEGQPEDRRNIFDVRFAACHTADPVANSFGTGVQEEFQKDGRTYEIKGQQQGDYKLKGREGEMPAGLSRRSRSNSAVRTGHKGLVPVLTREEIKAKERQRAKEEKSQQRGLGRDRVVLDPGRGRRRGGQSHG